MLYATVTLTDEFDVLPQKKKNELRLDLHRAPADPSEVILERARAYNSSAWAPILISLF